MSYLIALDEGTSSARTIVYDEDGQALAIESVGVNCNYPHPGWVEQDPEQIWSAQLESARRAIAKAGIASSEIRALGITNQRETTIVWDRHTGQAVAPAIVWQCRRTAEFCRQLAEGYGEFITQKTGLVLDAYFSASKIRWILDNHPGLRERAQNGELLFGTVDSWLVWKLTNGASHVTDFSNASRTMLMNLEAGGWDEELTALFEVPRVMLPCIVNSSGVVAETAPEHLGARIPIAGIAGDQQAALFGQACFREGYSKNTYGTGCFALLHTGQLRPQSKNRLLGTRAANLDRPQYAIEGAVFIAGAAVQWLRDSLGLLATAAESETLAASVPNNGGVYVVPAFVGLGAPHWDSAARGLITGLTRGASRAHLVRATLESIAFQTRELIEAMEADSNQPLAELRVDGGASANQFLMQFQADILGKPIVRPADIETTALGAAYLAGLATGVWSSLSELENLWRAERVFEPRMSEDQREDLWQGWQRAVRQCRATSLV
ncbi:MAG: glycerol kinase GlpK [Bryobacteraceae bacterium]|nr:glycerol kinase GlpK [Bryobacteraceae bacterium]MDW8379778.1 glycerol kinase GlpK [Bryobacterales bacterium]